jgi:hypothetical protein
MTDAVEDEDMRRQAANLALAQRIDEKKLRSRLAKQGKARKRKPGERVLIPVATIEFVEGGNTLWVHSPLGATVLRVKATGGITSMACRESPVSHADAIVGGAIQFCLAEDAE